jgi:hypothetical protein
LAGGVSTIGAVARYGPPDDFHNQPTQHAKFGMSEHPPSGEPPPPTDPPPTETPPDQYEPPESVDLLDQNTEPTPWYRKPVVLIGWALLVLILIALIVFGVMELIQGEQGTSRTPTTSTTPPTSTTTPPPTTTEATTPPTTTAVEPPAQQPTQQPTQHPTQQPTQQPTHRPHHLPPLPSVITIPEVPTTITLPPGLH